MDSVVAINCAAVVKATHAVLPTMLTRGRGAIVNISSIAGTMESTPYISVYGSTKAFVDHFTLSLADEYRHQGIDIQVKSPDMHTYSINVQVNILCNGGPTRQ